MLEMFKRYEFSRDEWFAIKEKCDQEDILFLSTPQNYTDLELLLEVGIPVVKVGSDDFTNLPLLKSYAKTKMPLLLSCGMSDLGEVYQALDTVGTFDGYPTILLLCTSQYPTPQEDVNLLKLKTLENAFPMLTLGFSDHTQGSLAAGIAVGLGAVVFEKHFTLSNDLPGPDHWFSENPENLQKWVDNIRNAYTMLGNYNIKPTAQEKKNKKEFQRVIVASKSISKEELFTTDNLTMRRIGQVNGLPPKMIEFLLGKKSNKDYQEKEPISLL